MADRSNGAGTEGTHTCPVTHAEVPTGDDVPAHVLMVWLSPAFPVGSFAYSHGLEAAREAGAIHDLASARAWIGDLVEAGGPGNDAILLAAAWRAVRDGGSGSERLQHANALALALSGSRERHLETVTQGNAFLTTVRSAWSTPAIEAAVAHLAGDMVTGDVLTGDVVKVDVAYPIAVGAVAGAAGFALSATLEAYLTAVVSNLASALVRLGAIGQTDGQRVIAGCMPAVRARAAFATAATLDDIGGAAFASDLAAIAHETLATRMFRS